MLTPTTLESKRLDATARRTAKRIGLQAKKTRWRQGTVDNDGGFMILDPEPNTVVAGSRFDMSAEDVIAFCVGC